MTDSTKTMHCECGNATYQIRWSVSGGDVSIWAECWDCGRPTTAVGDGTAKQMEWRAHNDD